MLREMEFLTGVANVMEQRREEYGDVFGSFEAIAGRWSDVLKMEVTAVQVAQCMMELKLARLAHQPEHKDTLVDIVGYATLMRCLREGEK